MPSSAVLAAEGVKAVASGKYTEGIEKLTEALKERPAPLWLLERSKAYVRTNELDLALYDAEKALYIAFERANRNQMVDAQLRRAITLYRLDRFADADVCAFWAIRLLDKARATEDDGQQNMVDENGEYSVRASEVKDVNPADKDSGFAAAMGQNSVKSKENSSRGQALSWRIQALTQLEKLPVGHPGRKVTVSEKYPKPSEIRPRSKAAQETVAPGRDDHDTKMITAELARVSTADSWESLWKRFLGVYKVNTIRSGFYQTDTTINADFFVKNVPADQFSVKAESQKVVMGPVPNLQPGSIQLHPWGRIKPAETKHTVKSMKIELVLQKEVPGKWPALQQEEAESFSNIVSNTNLHPSLQNFSTLVQQLGYKDAEQLQFPELADDDIAWYGAFLNKLHAGLGEPKVAAAPASVIPTAATGPASSSRASDTTQPKGDLTPAGNSTDQAAPVVSKAGSARTASAAPAYPTSSKKGVVNWDKFADGDEEENDPNVNAFFQQIYKNADDDTKRAMMKSYIESNGTSLSTNWNEAKDMTYKTEPPNGAEAKNWDE